MKTLKQIREEYNGKVLNRVEMPDEIMLDEAKQGATLQTIPSSKKMPVMLIFKRVSYRVFPKNQVVALYYSSLVDKYLSVPFGPDGNLNLSESTMLDNIEEGVKWETTKGAVKGALQGAAKGMAVGNAIGATPGAAIGGAVGAASGAIKGGRRAYAKAKDTTVDEDFRMKLEHLRNEGIGDIASTAWKVIKNLGKSAVKSLTGDDKSSDDDRTVTDRKSGERIRDVARAKTYSSWEKAPSTSDPITKKRLQQAALKENKIADIRKMVKEGTDSKDLQINGRTVTLNTSMAKRILEVYDSVNTKNKKIVEGMLNEDLESFKKLLNFSIRN